LTSRGAWPATLAAHWRLYAIEAAGLGGFLLVVGVADSLLFAPESPVDSLTSSDVLKRLGVGLAAGSYLIALVYSPPGMESGAHINPSITLGFLRLGKIGGLDAGFYVGAQFFGAVLGVALYAALLGSWASTPDVDYISTVPGRWGWAPAFAAELAITFAMFYLVLESTSSERFRPYTGVLCGVWLMLLIVFESPISGTSLNPARSTGSAVFAVQGLSLLLYFVAPPIGAQLAALLYRRARRGREVPCAKLHHHAPARPGTQRCIMKDCAHRRSAARPSAAGEPGVRPA
jgi:aquaporin Z